MGINTLRTRGPVIAGGLLLFTAAAAGPALAYPPGTSMTVTAANNQIQIANGQPGCTVTVRVNGTKVGSKTIKSDGTATIKASTPSGADVKAKVSGAGCTSESADTKVKSGGGGNNGGGGSGGGSGDNPSYTGSNTALGVLAGLGAIGVGGGLVVASRRKKA